MMAQYLGIKAEHPDALLFYRMGDFYEMFFEDAEAASAALDIALTKRGQHLGQDIAMCGVPAHSAEGYLLTLIRKGFRVAVCEQMEDPSEAKKRGSKSVVRREVTRLVTPGTLTEDSLLESRRHNFLAAFAEIRGEGALAWVDVSTGDVTVAPCPRPGLGPMLARIAPSEVLLPDQLEPELRGLVAEMGAVATPLARASFDSTAAEARIERLYGVRSLEGFAPFERVEIGALGGILDYLELTQKGRLPLLRPPARESAAGLMRIDAATRRNLELTRALSGGREGSLIAAVDRTVTGGGARLLEIRLNAPSAHVPTVRGRQAAVAHFVAAPETARAVRERLRRVPDLERALTRLALDRGGPRDLAAIRDALAEAGRLRDLLAAPDLPEVLGAALAALGGHEALAGMLDAALVAEPPLLLRDGGFVAAGYEAELDETRRLRDEGRGVVAALQADYVALAGINALKVKHNNVLGYFIETPATHAARMLAEPLNATFMHRQTTANAVRFTTLALAEIETKILNAGGHALDLERRIFEDLRRAVLDRSGPVAEAARALAEIDLAAALADLALALDWTRPEVDEGRAFEIVGGRHPVVELALAREGGTFVANDCDLSADGAGARPIWLLTGPNMAGKSTFLRQNAVIALLAQMGAYVPAARARIGVVDQLFSRVGAADDLARGRSTFMVEMVETAAILNQAGPRALVILDEIGRGTATYDGLSIAWATLEHLHDVNGCRGLFATHYHELTALAEKLGGLRNATVAVREWEGEVIFLHEVREGAADRSYGVQVAKLAGLPRAVVDRARVVLDTLERGDREPGGKAKALVDDLPLFSVAARTPPPAAAAAAAPEPSAAETRLRATQPDDLSPREALALVYELKGLLA
ncbi:MAG: DNA mismatch repair protein MutS [Rhodovulum sulfidophilum]|uniref:DNA mismatch repair protein MutS n=1 Tax=Rhodovulum sulfidophilum TaxID=35806 RepID=A0A2W5NGT3_RHOSU|nr:MAG: DNA mismatch repair protein MutS [Rhodovulum sulfidophilum]